MLIQDNNLVGKFKGRKLDDIKMEEIMFAGDEDKVKEDDNVISAQVESDKEDVGATGPEETFSFVEEQDDEEQDDDSEPPRKKRKTNSRVKWTKEEEEELQKYFKGRRLALKPLRIAENPMEYYIEENIQQL